MFHNPRPETMCRCLASHSFELLSVFQHDLCAFWIFHFFFYFRVKTRTEMNVNASSDMFRLARLMKLQWVKREKQADGWESWKVPGLHSSRTCAIESRLISEIHKKIVLRNTRESTKMKLEEHSCQPLQFDLRINNFELFMWILRDVIVTTVAVSDSHSARRIIYEHGWCCLRFLNGKCQSLDFWLQQMVMIERLLRAGWPESFIRLHPYKQHAFHP